MGKATVTVFAAAALVVGACSGGDSTGAPDADPAPTTAIANAATPEPAPTATPVPPTAEPAEPTATPQPVLSEDEAAVVAAWERYVVLSTEARGKSPSAEALDFGSYTVGSSLDRAREVADADLDAEEYLFGSTESLSAEVEVRDELTAVVEDCVLTDLSVVSRADDAVIQSFDEVVSVRARLELVGTRWLVAAQEEGTHICSA